MYKTALVLAVLLACLPQLAWSQATVHLPQGTRVTVHPRVEISSANAKTGDTVEFVVVDPVVVNGVTLIAGDAEARGTVTKAKHASGFGRSGELDISIDSVQAVDGSRVKLRATAKDSGANQTALSVGLFLFVSMLAVFVQGHEAVLPADKKFDVFINEDRDFAVTGTVPQAAAPAVVSVSTPAVASTSAGGTDSNGIQSLVFCQQVSAAGDPVGVSTQFTANAHDIYVWWCLNQASQAGDDFEVRWYQGTSLVTSSAVQIPAQSNRGAAVLSTPAGFNTGDWHVDLVKAGQVVCSQHFAVTP